MDPSSNQNALQHHQINRSKRILEEDMISQLPDAILHFILTLMPLSSSMRTSVLSRRWQEVCRCFWEHSTSLDFGDEFRNSTRTELEFVETVNRYLQLHSGINIKAFRLSFCPEDRFRPDFERWIRFAIERRVRELDLDFRRPYPPFPLGDSLTSSDSLAVLKQPCCEFSDGVKKFSGFSSLNTLCLRGVHISDDALRFLIATSPLLEELTLWDCKNLKTVQVVSPRDLKLKRLTVVDCSAHKIEIRAPNLLSFHFNGDFYEYLLDNISSLEDAIVTAVGLKYYIYKFYLFTCNRTIILSRVAHVRILTTCIGAIGDIARVALEGEAGILPITFPNLKELQLLMRVWGWHQINDVYVLFRYCYFPCLEKLFIEISDSRLQRVLDNNAWDHFSVPSGSVFPHLKIIKMNGFSGNEIEMRLVKFLLEKAAVLEYFVFVTIEKFNMALLKSLQQQLLLLPKASSEARLLLYPHSEDDSNISPTHSEVYDWI